MEISFEGAALRYGETLALAPLSLTLTEPRIGVIGLNGSGKTSFARLINGLALPSEGRVRVAGHDTATDAAAVRALAGFIFQNPANQIIMPTIREDIAFGLRSLGVKGVALETRVDAILDRLGIAGHADRRPHELSGGELQLAALAAVLVTAPGLVIFDEPTNQLDLRNRAVVAQAIEGLSEQAIVVSHDLDLVAPFGRVLVFDGGHLAFDGAGIEAVAFYRALAAR